MNRLEIEHFRGYVTYNMFKDGFHFLFEYAHPSDSKTPLYDEYCQPQAALNGPWDEHDFVVEGKLPPWEGTVDILDYIYI